MKELNFLSLLKRNTFIWRKCATQL